MVYAQLGRSGVYPLQSAFGALLDGEAPGDKVRLADRAGRLDPALQRRLTEMRTRLTALERLRETLGYQATLKRGFAVVRAGERIVTSKDAAAAASALELEFGDGRVMIGDGVTPTSPAKKKAKKPGPPESDQGSLF